jgi:hypothetical protein
MHGLIHTVQQSWIILAARDVRIGDVPMHIGDGGIKSLSWWEETAAGPLVCRVRYVCSEIGWDLLCEMIWMRGLLHLRLGGGFEMNKCRTFIFWRNTMQYHLQFFLAPNQTIILFVVRAYIKAVNVPNSNFLFSQILGGSVSINPRKGDTQQTPGETGLRSQDWSREAAQSPALATRAKARSYYFCFTCKLFYI